MKNEATREEAREILKNGILDMSVSRLIQMQNYSLMGSIALSNEMAFVENAFNCIDYNEENQCIKFSVKESQYSYGVISFSVNAITEISGCEDGEDPEDYLNINIKLSNDTAVIIKVLY